MNKYIEFYEKQDRKNVYRAGMNLKEHKFNNVLTSGAKILNYPILLQQFLVRINELIFKK